MKPQSLHSSSVVRTLGLAALGLLVACSSARAATIYSYDVDPNQLAPGKPQFSAPHGSGTNPFGFDWDSKAPGYASGAPTGYGYSSYYANVSQSGATEGDRYVTFRFGLRDSMGQIVHVGDIQSIKYQTDKNAPQTAIDWRPTIYTAPQGAGDQGSFYRNRIQALPQNSAGLNAPANQWNTWATDPGTNQLQFFTNRPGFTAQDIQFSELTSGPVTRGANSWDFRAEEVMMIDLTMGANSGGGTGASQLDAVVLTLTNGDILNLNLIPEPGTIALASLGLIGLTGYAVRRRRQRRVAAA